MNGEYAFLAGTILAVALPLFLIMFAYTYSEGVGNRVYEGGEVMTYVFGVFVVIGVLSYFIAFYALFILFAALPVWWLIANFLYD